MNTKSIFISLILVLSATLAKADDGNKSANIKAIKAHDVTITIDAIIPRGMPSDTSIDGYTLSVKGGKVNCDLPYRGEATSAMIYGVDEMGIVFKDCPVKITDDYSKADKGEYRWRFSARSGSSNVDVFITLFDSGSATISCIPDNRSPIDYSGTFGE